MPARHPPGRQAATVTDHGIPGWAPRWGPAGEQLTELRSILVGLRGRRIVDSRVVWDLEDNSWFADLPVVLLLDDHRQLEISWQKFDDLSISWDSLDLEAAPIGWADQPLAWQSQGHDALRSVNGRVITSTALTELLFTTGQTGTPGGWLVGGLLLETDGGSLHIFNALDENGLSFGPFEDTEDHRRAPL